MPTSYEPRYEPDASVEDRANVDLSQQAIENDLSTSLPAYADAKNHYELFTAELDGTAAPGTSGYSFHPSAYDIAGPDDFRVQAIKKSTVYDIIMMYTTYEVRKHTYYNILYDIM